MKAGSDALEKYDKGKMLENWCQIRYQQDFFFKFGKISKNLDRKQYQTASQMSLRLWYS